MTATPIQTGLAALCAATVLMSGCGGANNAGSDAATQSANAASSAAQPGPGAQPATTPPGQAILLEKLTGNVRENGILRLELTEAGFFSPAIPAPPGLRYYAMGLRGTSRSDGPALLGASKGDDLLLDVTRFVFAQNERGCISKPARGVAGLGRPIGDSITFPPKGHAEGQLAFLVPGDSTRVRLLIAPGGGDGLAVPVGADFTPSWPTPLQTIEDGTTMRVHVLPIPQTPAGLPPPASGREYVVVDVAIQNLKPDQGIEFQTSQQLRLAGAGNSFIQLSPAATSQVGCRLDDGDVIPPGHVRRLIAVFEVPPGADHRLHYRGFEKEDAFVNLRKLQ